MPKITFSPLGKSGDFPPETTLWDAAKELGIDIAHECGGFASCSTCRVLIESGEGEMGEIEFEEEDMLDLAELKPPYRLSCQAKVLGDVTARIDESGKEKDVRLEMPFDPAI